MTEDLREEIERLELDIQHRGRRLTDLRLQHAGLDAATLEEFEKLTSVERRKVYDADPDRYRGFMRQMRERNERRLAERQDNIWR